MIVQQRRHPVFNQNINLGMWQKSLDRGQRGGCENSIANRSKSNQQDLAHFLPIPTSWPKRPRRIFTLQGVHCFSFLFHGAAEKVERCRAGCSSEITLQWWLRR